MAAPYGEHIFNWHLELKEIYFTSLVEVLRPQFLQMQKKKKKRIRPCFLGSLADDRDWVGINFLVHAWCVVGTGRHGSHHSALS